MELTRYKLGDIATIYDGPHATPKRTDNGPVYLGIDAITEDCKINPNEFTFLSEEDYKIWTKRVVPQFKDIVFSYEATLGRYAIIPENFYGCLGRRLGIIRVKSDAVDYKWLYYFFQSPQWKCYIKNHIIKGSTVNRISVDEMPGYEIPACGIADQKKIASVLSALDDKIALNKKMNQKLEAMAKRLYDYWFVQYDFPDKNGHPYKTTGGPMTYNPTLKREIPAGWVVKSLFDCSDVLYGFPYATEPFDEENLDTSTKPYPVIRIRDIKDNSISAKTTEIVDDKYRTKVNDLLIGMDGYFHMSFWPRNDDYVNQRITRIRQKELSVMIIYHQIAPFIKFKEDQAKGSTVGHLSDKDMKQINILVPNNPRLSEKFDSILNLITKNKQEISRLTKLRDKLLPLLMNGQVEVK
jgi:type I restriction enzyme S subunit